MYIKPEDRAGWDFHINKLLHYLCSPEITMTPSKSGLSYALSRIVWAIFDRWPSHTVGSDLRAILTDVRDEFTRRKLQPFDDNMLTDNGDLPEGALAGVFGPGTTQEQVAALDNTVTTQQGHSASLPPGMKIVTMSELEECFNAGKSLESLLSHPKIVPGRPVITDKALKMPVATPPIILDPAAEDDAERRLILSIKALALARVNKASNKTVTKLAEGVNARLIALLKLLGVE